MPAHQPISVNPLVQLLQPTGCCSQTYPLQPISLSPPACQLQYINSGQLATAHQPSTPAPTHQSIISSVSAHHLNLPPHRLQHTSPPPAAPQPVMARKKTPTSLAPAAHQPITRSTTRHLQPIGPSAPTHQPITRSIPACHLHYTNPSDPAHHCSKAPRRLQSIASSPPAFS